MFWQKLKNRIHPKNANALHKRLTSIDFRTTIVEKQQVENETKQVEPKLLYLQSEHQTSGGHHNVINFHDIVDEDDRSVENRFSHVFVGWLIESLPFRMFMLVAILLNCLVIGLQTDKYLEENYNAVFIALDKFFLTVFVLEILVKWYHDFFGFWRAYWNIFDFVIVAFSLLGPSLTFLSGSRWLTILRVLRALRSLRSISALRGLQIVVQTVVHSLPDMANIVALLLICMFIFGILGYSFFGEHCKQHFGSLGTTMFSLFICVTQDGWMGITLELNSCGYSILGAIYLLIFITIGAFIFANLVVAVVVTNLEWAIAEQKELEENMKQSKQLNDKPTSIVTVDTEETLTKLAKQQEPIEIPQMSHLKLKTLEDYFLVISAEESNLAEFKRIQEQITEIHNEIKALATLEDVSDDEVFELSAMAGGTSHVSSSLSLPPPVDLPRRRFNSLANGDAISDLMAMSKAYPQASSKPKNIHQMITSLATASAHHNGPHSQSVALLRPSMAVHTRASHSTIRAESAL